MSKNLIADRYEAFQHIGQGGMADVFLAVDTILNRQVAVKILRSELCTDAVAIIRFEREAQAATALSHPNIVEIYDVGEYKGHHFIVMEYVPGKTLKKVIHDRGALLIEEAIDISKQLASATGEAHRKGIIHRDIKPQNVIVKSDGSVKILDFGIALAKGSIQVTDANNVMGSVHYLAPELAKGESASVQSDIYALGIVLFEMLTGDVPFKADSAVQVALMQMRNEIPSVRSINSQIPQSVENIILKATAKDPKMRYRSCNEMYEDLRTCLRPERLNEPRVVLSPRDVSSDIGFDEFPDKVLTDTGHNQTLTVRKEGTRVIRPAVQKEPKKNRFLLGLMISLLTLLAGAGIYFALGSLGVFQTESRYVEVPNLVGMTMTEANDVCNENSLVLDRTNVNYTLTESMEKGKIISVEPQIGESIEKGSRVSVVVSSGIYAVAENYIGQNISDAMARINELHKNIVLTTVEEKDDSAVPGTVIRQELLEPNAKYNPETKTELRLVYAAYPTIVIPLELEGMDIDEADRYLSSMDVKVLRSKLDSSNLSEEEKANLQYYVVIKSNPDLGTEFSQKEDNYIVLYYFDPTGEE